MSYFSQHLKHPEVFLRKLNAYSLYGKKIKCCFLKTKRGQSPYIPMEIRKEMRKE